jgi:hypothetical protein
MIVDETLALRSQPILVLLLLLMLTDRTVRKTVVGRLLYRIRASLPLPRQIVPTAMTIVDHLRFKILGFPLMLIVKRGFLQEVPHLCRIHDSLPLLLNLNVRISKETTDAVTTLLQEIVGHLRCLTLASHLLLRRTKTMSQKIAEEVRRQTVTVGVRMTAEEDTTIVGVDLMTAAVDTMIAEEDQMVAVVDTKTAAVALMIAEAAKTVMTIVWIAWTTSKHAVVLQTFSSRRHARWTKMYSRSQNLRRLCIPRIF